MKLLPLFLSLILTQTLHPEELTSEQIITMKELYFKNGCNGCHGNYGEGMGASPRLQGQNEEVLLRRFNDLKNGKTRTAFGTIMISFAKSMDENQTKQMASFLAQLKVEKPKELYDLRLNTSGGGS